jgi:phosphatidyl-myo-inositol dimannoside synthase
MIHLKRRPSERANGKANRLPAMLALVTDAFGGRGGIAQHNRDVLQALVQIQAVSDLAVLPRTAPDAALPPPQIEQMRARHGRVAYSLAAIKFALLRPFDIVLCGHIFMAPLALLVARLKKAKLIVQTYGIEAWRKPTDLQLMALRSADLLFCISRYTREALIASSGVDPERVALVPTTVRDAFTPGDGSAFREQLQLVTQRVLLTVARMDSRQRHKGQDLVIAALPFLLDRGHDVHYVVIGEGDDQPRLEALAEELGVSERVHFLGAAGLETVIAAYRTADLFVMPSKGEGFGIAFIEAMACGTRALGLNIAGAKDALADGELGMCIPEAELAAAIDQALAAPRPDPEILSQRVRARFGRETLAANLNTAFDRLLKTA